MLIEFSSAAHTSCARSHRRSIAAVMSNVYVLRTTKPNSRDDIGAVTKTQARCEVSCCGAAEYAAPSCFLGARRFWRAERKSPFRRLHRLDKRRGLLDRALVVLNWLPFPLNSLRVGKPAKRK